MPFHSLRYALSGLSLILCMWGAEIPPTVDAGPPSAGFRTFTSFTACNVESSASISERVYSWITPLSSPCKPTPGKPILPAPEGLRESVPMSLKVFVRVDFVLTMK
jgi:hypothetical protein